LAGAVTFLYVRRFTHADGCAASRNDSGRSCAPRS
jgi:hypothetical protein